MPHPDHRKDGDFRRGNTAAQKRDHPADHILHVRVPGPSKGRWVEASRAKGQKLSEWVVETLDRALDNRDQNSQ